MGERQITELDVARELNYRRGYHQGMFDALRAVTLGARPAALDAWETAVRAWRLRGSSGELECPPNRPAGLRNGTNRG